MKIWEALRELDKDRTLVARRKSWPPLISISCADKDKEQRFTFYGWNQQIDFDDWEVVKGDA